MSETYEGDWPTMIQAAVAIATSSVDSVDDGVREAANELLRTEFKAATINGRDPDDNPAQTDVEDEEDPE